MNAFPFSQAPYRCRLDWGRRGCRAAAARGEVLVVVDTLSFSTAVATAIDRGGRIYPCAPEEDAADLAARVSGVAAVGRRDVPDHGRFSLSPQTYLDMEPGTRVALASPNGGLCSRYGRGAPYLFIGALVNARAVARAVSRVLASSGLCVTVLACGERWRAPSEDGALRMAVEDYLGAGAILSCLEFSQSPEARVCAGAFRQAAPDLEEILRECGSGRELQAKGFEEDVLHAARLNLYDSVPVLRGEGIERL
ncbi:MAG TPA: 2-phosphosulfolactate phosphatase [Chthonomonadaceae bacterium]|nr:2-phosphosulfolactate phosphatase [Chthonomonadaceae bacterium]